MKRWLAIFGLLIAVSEPAHEVRPAFLELTERAPGEFDVLWKVPAIGGTPLAGEELPHQHIAIPLGQRKQEHARRVAVDPMRHESAPPDRPQFLTEHRQRRPGIGILHRNGSKTRRFERENWPVTLA